MYWSEDETVRRWNRRSESSVNSSGYSSDLSDKENSGPSSCWVVSSESLISPLRSMPYHTVEYVKRIKRSKKTNITNDFADCNIGRSGKKRVESGDLRKPHKEQNASLTERGNLSRSPPSFRRYRIKNSTPTILRRTLRPRKITGAYGRQSTSLPTDPMPSFLGSPPPRSGPHLASPPPRRPKLSKVFYRGGTTLGSDLDFSPSQFFNSGQTAVPETPRSSTREQRLTSTPSKPRQFAPFGNTIREGHLQSDSVRTPTPFKKALKELHETCGRPKSPSPNHFDRDMADIMERDYGHVPARSASLSDDPCAKQFYISPAETPSKTVKSELIFSPSKSVLMSSEASLLLDDPPPPHSNSSSSGTVATTSTSTTKSVVATPPSTAAALPPQPEQTDEQSNVTDKDVKEEKQSTTDNSSRPAMRRKKSSRYSKVVFEDDSSRKFMSEAARRYVTRMKVKPRKLHL